MNVFPVDGFLKEFSNTFKILLFLSISNDCSILRSKKIEEIYFRTIRTRAFHLFQLPWTHSSKVAALVWDDCKMPIRLGYEQLSWFFFFCSSEAFLVLTINRKFNRRVNFILKRQKSWSDLLMDNMLGKMVIVTTEQKSCTHLLICGSHCICRSVFRFFCMYHFFFCSSAYLESMRHSKASLNTFWTELNQLLNEMFQIFFSIRFSRCQNRALKVWF